MTRRSLNRSIGVALTVATFGALSACGESEDGSSTAKKTDGPIKIGFALAESGAMEAYDGPARFGAEQAIREINEAGGIDGRKVEGIFGDTKSDPAEGANAAIKALDAGAQALVVACGFDFGGATAGIEADKRGVMAISTCGAGSRFGPETAQRLFTMATSAFSDGAVMAEVAKKRGVKRPFVIEESNTDFDTEVALGFVNRWKELGGEIAGQSEMKNDDQSFSAQVSEIRGAKADAVMLATYPPGLTKMIRQMRGAGLDVPIFGTEDFDGESWKKGVPDLRDVIFPAPLSQYGNDPKDKVNELVAAYEGDDLTYGLFFGFSAVEAVTEAIKENGGSTDGAELTKIMEGWKDKEFLVGPTTFDADSHITTSREERIMEIDGGKTNLAEVLRPEQVPTDR